MMDIGKITKKLDLSQSEIGELRDLSVLGLSTNLMTGSLPAEVARLDELQILLIMENELTGW